MNKLIDLFVILIGYKMFFNNLGRKDFFNYVEFWSFKICLAIEILLPVISMKILKKDDVPNQHTNWSINTKIQMEKLQLLEFIFA